MAANDYFADIAMTAHPVSSTDREIEPVEIRERVVEALPASLSKEGIVFSADLTEAEKLARFQKDLAALRRKYSPFLADYSVPAAPEKTIAMKTFDFRFMKDGEIFSDLAAATDWESVEIPDYRGPVGKWKACYRRVFAAEKPKPEERAILSFQCVDYKAVIYLNGSFVGQHEGFFAPFSFDVSDYLKETNQLVIEIENDYSILGEGDIDGDKVYAATGLGWDDPDTGWHHCPAGAGVFGRVELIYTPMIRVEDLFARPDIDAGFIELRVGVANYAKEIYEDYELQAEIVPKNFTDGGGTSFQAHIGWIGIGKNEYRYRIRMPADFRLWNPETPYLYALTVRLSSNQGRTADSVKKEHFGMRKFISDETSEPKGRFYLNNRPILMRGANEMGHLPQCVLKEDYAQLIDDILIAKLCHMNYYRLTQRPVQKEIYDYMDMLGMMTQTDLPLFSFLRRPQFAECIRQTVEMEHLIRNHPSAFMVTFINEPVCIRRTADPNSKFSKRYDKKGHRELLRDELEAFFAAARKAVYVENPDRVIKNVEGDYDAPTMEGMPDFHCYTMWYSNHGVPVGKLMRGYLPPVKSGWMVGCGEYGAEGLDNEPIMWERYPKKWMEMDEEGHWYPTRIVRAQTNGTHGDWYPEQDNVSDWVRESQIHQEHATRVMTDAFRRRSDILNHTAIHLLIDAWPSGWMKTLVGCDRIPKRAFFAYQESLTPVRISIRSDRRYFYGGECAKPEIWLLNDTAFTGPIQIKAVLCEEDRIYASYAFDAEVPAATAQYAASLALQLPEGETCRKLRLDVWCEKEGEVIYTESFKLYAYPKPEKAAAVTALGKEAEAVAAVLSLAKDAKADAWLSSEPEENEAEIRKALDEGKTVVVLAPEGKDMHLSLTEGSVSTKKGPKLFFHVALPKYHLEFLYNEAKDYIDFQSVRVIETDCPCQEIAYTYGKQAADGRPAPKRHLPTAVKISAGKGTLYVTTLLTEGRVGVNANLDTFLRDCINNIF